MLEYSVNVEPLFPGNSLYEKVKLAKTAGFNAVEFWGWKDLNLRQFKSVCEENGISISAFCGQDDQSLCDRRGKTKYIDWVRRSIDAARYLECENLIIFSNHFTESGSSDFRDQYSYTAMLANMVNTLTLLVPYLEESGMTLLLEPLHNRGQDAGMILTDTSQGAAIVRAVDSKHVRLLCDLFHMQTMHGDLWNNLTDVLDVTPYLHIADAPSRNEPGTGEINFRFLVDSLKNIKYDGVVCFEFFPSGDSMVALDSAKQICL